MEKKFYKYKYNNYFNEYVYFRMSEEELKFAKWFIRTISDFLNSHTWRSYRNYCDYLDEDIEEISESEIKDKNIDIGIFDWNRHHCDNYKYYEGFPWESTILEYRDSILEEGEKYIYCCDTYFKDDIEGYEPRQCYFELTPIEANFINWFLRLIHIRKKFKKLHRCTIVKSREEISFK